MISLHFLKVSTIALAVGFGLSACGQANDSASAPENASINQASAPETPSETVIAEPTSEPAPATETPEEPELSPEFASLPEPYNAADYARGRRTFRQCSSCHLVEDGAGHLVGPNLYGMFGRQVGGAEGFSYSNAVQEADFVWTPEKLDEWLASPRNFCRAIE